MNQWCQGEKLVILLSLSHVSRFFAQIFWFRFIWRGVCFTVSSALIRISETFDDKVLLYPSQKIQNWAFSRSSVRWKLTLEYTVIDNAYLMLTRYGCIYKIPFWHKSAHFSWCQWSNQFNQRKTWPLSGIWLRRQEPRLLPDCHFKYKKWCWDQALTPPCHCAVCVQQGTTTTSPPATAGCVQRHLVCSPVTK